MDKMVRLDREGYESTIGLYCRAEDVTVLESKLEEAISIFEKMSCEDFGIGLNTEIDKFLNSIK